MLHTITVFSKTLVSTQEQSVSHHVGPYVSIWPNKLELYEKHYVVTQNYRASQALQYSDWPQMWSLKHQLSLHQTMKTRRLKLLSLWR